MTSTYIELNPVRAGIVRDPADYPWSTFRLHLGLSSSQVPASLWTPNPWFLSLASHSTLRAKKYEAWMQLCLENNKKPLYAEKMDVLEKISLSYSKRLERPNRSRAI